MLILRRKPGEQLLIGDNIRITVMDVSEGGVRLAIEAPREITILRSELKKAVDVNRDAANEQSEPQQLLNMLNQMREKSEEPK
ncbi:MAG: carbon storage regulator [Oscillospiraceae bacterium]|nr:carbon storage regulator [Oscillospiraceae bacterium]